MPGLMALVMLIIGLLLVALPVKLAASAMGARRTGFFWCFLALIGASILHAIGLSVPVLERSPPSCSPPPVSRPRY